MRRLGVTVPFASFDVAESCELARRAEVLGYSDVWAAETADTDSFAVLAAVAMVTERARLGVAIVPVFTRPPALIAMGAAAVQQASRGRFCLGLGVSTPTIVTGWMGLPYDKPVARMRETIAVVRSALAGDKVALEGETLTVSGFRLGTTVADPVPIFVAALGPRMMALAASDGDGIALFLTTEDGVRIATEAAPGKDVMARLICCPDEPAADVRNFARWWLAPYVAADGYNAFLTRQGFGEEAAIVQKLWRAGERDGARAAMPDALVDALVLLGPADDCRARIESMRAAGLTTPILSFLSLQGRDGIPRALEAMAPG